MEKAEISRLINSFNAIKGYFDTTKKYMPQIAKLVFFIEEVIPLLNTIHSDLHQSSLMIPSATEKLDKVTSATEMATTEVMDIVDRVIERLGTMTSKLDQLEEKVEKGVKKAEEIKSETTSIREEIDGSQDDLFSIMNALQFQDITTQQIHSIGQVIDTLQGKLGELLRGFDDEGFQVARDKNYAFDSEAEFDFDRSKKSQEVADEYLKKASELKEQAEKQDPADEETESQDEIILGDDGQPDISAIMNSMSNKKK